MNINHAGIFVVQVSLPIRQSGLLPVMPLQAPSGLCRESGEIAIQMLKCTSAHFNVGLNKRLDFPAATRLAIIPKDTRCQ